jgi:hypothetical protein
VFIAIAGLNVLIVVFMPGQGKVGVEKYCDGLFVLVVNALVPDK